MEKQLYILMIVLAAAGSLFFIGGLIALIMRKRIPQENRKKFTVISIIFLALGLLAVLIPVGYTVYLQLDLTGTAYNYETSLEGLAQTGDYEGVKELLLKGADPDETYQPYEGNAPILCAAINGDRKMVSLLLEYGADINSEDARGYTALFFAATEFESTGLLEFLIEKGADVKHLSHSGETAAHIAAAAENLDAVKLLRKNGADMSAVTAAGQSIIYYACTPNGTLPSYELLRFLTENGADLTYIDSDGNDLAEVLENSHVKYISLYSGNEDFDNDKQNKYFNRAGKYMRAQVDAALKRADHKK